MSIEFYIQGYNEGKADGLHNNQILSAFGKAETDQEDGLYRLVYDAKNSCDVSITVKNDLATGICIYRPCCHEKLYQSIFRVLTSGPYVLFAPDGKSPIVARRDMAAHLPDGMAEALGQPIVVTDAKSIMSALFD